MNNIGENIYPYCYRIGSGCPPCNMTNLCLENFSNYVVISESPYKSNEDKENALKELVKCLRNYEDLYYRAGIELYVNPKTKEINFPDKTRIQANFNQFLREIGKLNTKDKDRDNLYEKTIMEIFTILLNDKFREIYNKIYKSHNLAYSESLKPKEYGITNLLGQPNKILSDDINNMYNFQKQKTENISQMEENNMDFMGGRRSKGMKTKRRKTKRRKTKRRKTKKI